MNVQGSSFLLLPPPPQAEAGLQTLGLGQGFSSLRADTNTQGQSLLISQHPVFPPQDASSTLQKRLGGPW